MPGVRLVGYSSLTASFLLLHLPLPLAAVALAMAAARLSCHSL